MWQPCPIGKHPPRAEAYRIKKCPANGLGSGFAEWGWKGSGERSLGEV